MEGSNTLLKHELGQALREFACPEDLSPDNKSVLWIEDRGGKRICFRRNLNFVPSDKNRIAAALKALEDGDTGPLAQIDKELQAAGITLRFDTSPLDGGKCMIDRVILQHRGDIHERLGLVLN